MAVEAENGTTKVGQGYATVGPSNKARSFTNQTTRSEGRYQVCEGDGAGGGTVREAKGPVIREQSTVRVDQPSANTTVGYVQGHRLAAEVYRDHEAVK